MVTHLMNNKDTRSSDAAEVRDILEAVQETVPQLISSLVQSIYSPEVAKTIAESVGALYQELKKKGIPDDLVLEMTRNYMSIMDIKEIISEGISKGQTSDEIERAVRKKLAKKEIE